MKAKSPYKRRFLVPILQTIKFVNKIKQVGWGNKFNNGRENAWQTTNRQLYKRTSAVQSDCIRSAFKRNSPVSIDTAKVNSIEVKKNEFKSTYLPKRYFPRNFFQWGCSQLLYCLLVKHGTATGQIFINLTSFRIWKHLWASNDPET